MYLRNELTHSKWRSGREYIIQAKRGVKKNRGVFPQFGSEFYEAGISLDHPFENTVFDYGKAHISSQNFNIQVSHMVGQIDHVGEGKRLKQDFGGFFILLLRKDREWFRSNGALSTCRGVHFESVCQVLWRGKIRYVCVYLLHKCSRWSVPGFPRLSDNFVPWGLELNGTPAEYLCPGWMMMSASRQQFVLQ